MAFILDYYTLRCTNKGVRSSCDLDSLYSYALSCDLESLNHYTLSCIVLDQTVRYDLLTFRYTRENSLMEYCKCKQSCDLYFIRLYEYLQTRTIIWLMFYSTYKYFKHEQSWDYFLQQYKYRIDYFSFMFNYTNTLWPLEYRICKFKKSCDFWSMWDQTPNFPCWRNGLFITWLYICDRHVWCEISIQDSWILQYKTFFDITNIAKKKHFQRIFQYGWTCDRFKL